MFGFAYKAVNTNVKVSFIIMGDSNHVVVLDRFMEKVNGDESEGWHYFLKNLTHVDFLKNAWDSDSKVDWRVSVHHNEFEQWSWSRTNNNFIQQSFTGIRLPYFGDKLGLNSRFY